MQNTKDKPLPPIYRGQWINTQKLHKLKKTMVNNTYKTSKQKCGAGTDVHGNVTRIQKYKPVSNFVQLYA